MTPKKENMEPTVLRIEAVLGEFDLPADRITKAAQCIRNAIQNSSVVPSMLVEHVALSWLSAKDILDLLVERGVLQTPTRNGRYRGCL
jgi:hypothetical protein